MAMKPQAKWMKELGSNLKARLPVKFAMFHGLIVSGSVDCECSGGVWGKKSKE